MLYQIIPQYTIPSRCVNPQNTGVFHLIEDHLLQLAFSFAASFLFIVRVFLSKQRDYVFNYRLIHSSSLQNSVDLSLLSLNVHLHRNTFILNWNLKKKRLFHKAVSDRKSRGERESERGDDMQSRSRAGFKPTAL